MVYKKFDELSLLELYAILQLRSEVFVEEQKCCYTDMDGKDMHSLHVMHWDDGILTAHARLLPPGLVYAEASIGRVAVKRTVRGAGLGIKLIAYSIAACYREFGKTAIKIGAQLYLKKFYESFGFVQCSTVYDDVGIAHIKMLLNPLPKSA